MALESDSETMTVDSNDTNQADPRTEDSSDPGSPRSIGRNQADGLRALFGDGEPALFCIASALPADATVTLGLGTSHALRRAGHRTLLVDEVPLVERNMLKGFAYPVRYDLGQVFNGDVPMERGIRKVADNLWFATGVKLRKTLANGRARGPTLVERLRQFDPGLDVVVVITSDPFGPSIALYGQDAQRVLVAGPDDASLARALSHVRELSTTSGGESVPVLMVGGSDEVGAREAFDRLQRTAQALLEQSLVWNGWVRAASARMFGEPEGDALVLPVSLYRTLARRIATQPVA